MTRTKGRALMALTNMLRDPHEGSGTDGFNSENSVGVESNLVCSVFGVLAALGVGSCENG